MKQTWSEWRAGAPVILCQVTRTGEWKFKCQYCRRWHLHSDGYGHRQAHCHWDRASPYKATGYHLTIKD